MNVNQGQRKPDPQIKCAYCCRPFNRKTWATNVRGGVCSHTCHRRSGQGFILPDRAESLAS